MTEFIENIFSSIFGNNVILATILIAFVPIIELKGAIPFSMSAEIWGSSALSLWPAFLCGLLGSCLVVPLLALIYTPIIKWLKSTKLFRGLAEKLENKVNSKKKDIENKFGNAQLEQAEDKESNNLALNSEKKKIVYDKKFFLKALGVFTFVAIPLPLTGVWTGTCIAVALGLGFWGSCASVILGNVVAGFIITFVSHLFGDATLIFFYILISIIVVALLVMLIFKLINKKKNKVDNN